MSESATAVVLLELVTMIFCSSGGLACLCALCKKQTISYKIKFVGFPTICISIFDLSIDHHQLLKEPSVCMLGKQTSSCTLKIKG